MVSKIQEIFKWRHLLFSLALKDLNKKYRHATGGFGWMLFMPLLQTVIFAIIFKFLFKVEIENYPLFLLSGLFPWSFLKSSLDGASSSILVNANLIKKTYFPREILPASNIITNFVNFCLSLFILLLFCFFYKIQVFPAILWLPLVVLIQLFLINGLALFFAGTNAIYRETQFILEILLFIWFYITPIVYPLTMIKNKIPDELFRVYALNPLLGIIYSYQQIFVYGNNPDLGILVNSAFVSVCVLFIGELIFLRCESIFVDII